jgi:hypothetical protein
LTGQEEPLRLQLVMRSSGREPKWEPYATSLRARICTASDAAQAWSASPDHLSDDAGRMVADFGSEGLHADRAQRQPCVSGSVLMTEGEAAGALSPSISCQRPHAAWRVPRGWSRSRSMTARGPGQSSRCCIRSVEFLSDPVDDYPRRSRFAGTGRASMFLKTALRAAACLSMSAP